MNWLAVQAGQFTQLSGTVSTYIGNTGSQRQFCPNCGTGLFFRNEQALPGIVDIQAATLDDPASANPQAQIQCAERLGWMTGLDDLPQFDRFPG